MNKKINNKQELNQNIQQKNDKEKKNSLYF